MVRRTARVKYADDSGGSSIEEASDYNDESEAEIHELPIKKRKLSPQKKSSPRKKKAKMTPRGKISKSKTPSKGSARKYDYVEESGDDVIDDNNEDEEASDPEDSDFEYGKKKRRKSTPSKKTPSKSKKGKSKQGVQKKGRGGWASYSSPPKPKHNFPPVSEMVIESIKALKDPPRKGSTLSSIKETILLNWPVNMKIYDAKIKKFITKAIERKEIVQTKGHGFRGRFTVPGMKAKKRKKKNRLSLGKKFDEDEVEYKPSKTSRDEEREKSKEELEQLRIERKHEEEKKIEEKAARPKKVIVRKEKYEVEAIKGMKHDKDGNKFYLVKFEGYSKPQWEPEENVQDCNAIVDEFLEKEEVRKKEKEERKRKEEEEGCYEVARVLEVKFTKDKKREFLIRWKGASADDDTWEPEENLDCEELIDKFMATHAERLNVSEKNLRIAPKKVERLAFAKLNSRNSKRNNGFRVTYEDMDE